MTRKLGIAVLLAALALPAAPALALPPMSKGVIVSNPNTFQLGATFTRTGTKLDLFWPGIQTGDVATGDVNGDNTDDLVFGSYRDADPRVVVIDGRTRTTLMTLTPQKPDARGVRVGVGDLNGDGRADIATAPADGPGPVRVYDGTTGAVLRAFYPFTPTFSGGVSVALGDINGDGRDDIVTGKMREVGHVKVFDGVTNATLRSFTAFAGTSTEGVDVAAGNVAGDWREDIVLAGRDGWASRAEIWDLEDRLQVFSLGQRWESLYDMGDTDIETVDVGNLDADSALELVFGGGSPVESLIIVYDSGAIVKRFQPFASPAVMGVGVAVQRVQTLG